MKNMKISPNTMSMLKSFSSINTGIVFKKGNVLKIQSPEETIHIEVGVPEDFPKDFGIYDLSNFLGNISSLNVPELTFVDGENYVLLSDSEKTEFKYGLTDIASDAISYPKEDRAMTDPEVTFQMSEASLTKVTKFCNINGFLNISFVGKGNKILAKASDKNNKNSNVATIEILNDYKGPDFEMDFKAGLLKMLPMDYTVSLKLDSFALFENTEKQYKYFVVSSLED